jgi:hypothetical protein
MSGQGRPSPRSRQRPLLVLSAHSFKSRVIRLVKPAQRWLLHMPDEFIIGSELLLHPSIQTNHEFEETILFSREQAFLLRNCHVRE